METTPTDPRLRTPVHPRAPMFSAPMFSGTSSASPSILPSNILCANFAAPHLLRAKSARTPLVPPSTFSRCVTQLFAALRRARHLLWRALVHRARRTPKSLRVAETAALGDRRFVAVVEFERQRFLIGTSPSAVTLLASLPDAGSRDGASHETNRVRTEPCPVPPTASCEDGTKPALSGGEGPHPGDTSNGASQ